MEWSELNVYIIRAYSDCQKEVNVIYDSVLPKIRQVCLGGVKALEVLLSEKSDWLDLPPG